MNCTLKPTNASANQPEAKLLCPLLSFNHSKVSIQLYQSKTSEEDPWERCKIPHDTWKADNNPHYKDSQIYKGVLKLIWIVFLLYFIKIEKHLFFNVGNKL